MNRSIQMLLVVVSMISVLSGCASDNHYPLSNNKFSEEDAAPPADSSIIGTWRFASAGDHKILWSFLMKFDKYGKHTSGPTPFALTQKTNYTFDGNQIVIAPGENQVVIPDVKINGRVMQFYGEDGGEPLLLTYQRISKW